MARSLCLHSIFSCIVDVLAWKPNHTTAESSSKSWDRLPLSSLFLASSLFLKRRSICDWSAVLSQPLFCTGYNCVAALNSFGIQVQFCAEQCKKKTPHSKFANEGYLWADFIKVQFSGAVQLLFLWHFRDLIKEEISSINIFILWVNWTPRKKGHSFVLLHLFHEKTQPFFFRSPRDFKLLWNLSLRGTSHCTLGFINMIVVIYLSSTISGHLPKFLR